MAASTGPSSTPGSSPRRRGAPDKPRLILPSQSLSTPTGSGSFSSDSLGTDTDLGKDLSQVPNAQLGQVRDYFSPSLLLFSLPPDAVALSLPPPPFPTHAPQYRALVLDVSYRAIDTVPWTRAVVLDYFDKVDVLEYYDSFVRSARDYHYLPAVVRVKFYVKKLKGAFDKGVPLTRKNVYARDQNSCQYCGSKKNLTLDHVVPMSKGGGTSWENLVTACSKCNQKKGDKLLKELGSSMKLKKEPYRPSHSEMSRYMVGRSAGSAPKEWLDYLPPGTAEWFCSEENN